MTDFWRSEIKFRIVEDRLIDLEGDRIKLEAEIDRLKLDLSKARTAPDNTYNGQTSESLRRQISDLAVHFYNLDDLEKELSN